MGGDFRDLTALNAALNAAAPRIIVIAYSQSEGRQYNDHLRRDLKWRARTLSTAINLRGINGGKIILCGRWRERADIAAIREAIAVVRPAQLVEMAEIGGPITPVSLW
jgi:hypothetical protein